MTTKEFREIREEQGEPNRCSGRTTRSIDNAIQKLFIDDSVFVRDAFHEETPFEPVPSISDKLCFTRVLNRLNTEHPHIQYVVIKEQCYIELI